jgi:hypothetical protein
VANLDTMLPQQGVPQAAGKSTSASSYASFLAFEPAVKQELSAKFLALLGCEMLYLKS